MSITPTTNYMSNESIEAWMESKTEDIYGKMRGAMDTSNDRASAEDQLNDIKAKLLEMKTGGSRDAGAVLLELKNTIKQYGAEFPDMAKPLQGIADQLDSRYAQAITEANRLSAPQATLVNNQQYIPGQRSFSAAPQATPQHHDPAPVTLSNDDVDTWSKIIDSSVDDLGKQDQLGMINIQEFNAQLNQAKQTASALMDSADKSASTIISHIS